MGAAAPPGGPPAVGMVVSGSVNVDSDVSGNKRRERRRRAWKARAERKAKTAEQVKEVRKRPAPVPTRMDDGTFETVRSRRVSAKEKESRKLEELKTMKPQRAFIVSVAGEKEELVNRKLWNEIVAKVALE